MKCVFPVKTSDTSSFHNIFYPESCKFHNWTGPEFAKKGTFKNVE